MMAKYVNNSSVSDDIYDGRLEYVGDGTEAEGNPWLPVSPADIAARYPKDGTINLKAGSDGKGSLRINTRWIPSQTSSWYVAGIYDIVMGESYKSYLLEYYTDGTANVWYGSESVPLVLSWENTRLQYSPKETPFMITERPDVPIIPFVTFDTIPNITSTNPITVTMRFNTAPKPTFLLSDLTYNNVNGTITNLQQTSDDRVWTFTYTANSGIDDTTNVITAGTNYYDDYGNKATTASVSNNFSVVTAVPQVNIVPNWDFVTSSGWYIYMHAEETGTITHDAANGRYYFNNTIQNSGIRRILYDLEPNRDYTIEFQITGRVRGQISAFVEGQTPSPVYRNANGVYTQDITSAGTVPRYVDIFGQYAIGFHGYIEYIKVLER